MLLATLPCSSSLSFGSSCYSRHHPRSCHPIPINATMVNEIQCYHLPTHTTARNGTDATESWRGERSTSAEKKHAKRTPHPANANMRETLSARFNNQQLSFPTLPAMVETKVDNEWMNREIERANVPWDAKVKGVQIKTTLLQFIATKWSNVVVAISTPTYLFMSPRSGSHWQRPWAVLSKRRFWSRSTVALATQTL